MVLCDVILSQLRICISAADTLLQDLAMCEVWWDLMRHKKGLWASELTPILPYSKSTPSISEEYILMGVFFKKQSKEVNFPAQAEVLHVKK